MSKTMTWEEYSDELKVRLDDKTAELAKVKQQLAIAVEALCLIDKRKCHMANCLQNCPLRKYYEKNQGCATCLNNACHTALQQIKELDK